MLTHTDRLNKNLTAKQQVVPSPVLLRTKERTWFGTQERSFNPLVGKATLLRSGLERQN